MCFTEQMLWCVQQEDTGSCTPTQQIRSGNGGRGRSCLQGRCGAHGFGVCAISSHGSFPPENKSFLISEAVRGEGAILRNIKGERFMPKYHELKELAPRDIVSRSIFMKCKNKFKPCISGYHIQRKGIFGNRFPNIYNTCLSYGIDMSKDYIPVAPAEHYCMGGIRTDVFGRTNIKGFYACGEVACNGIHGANRLASNSLLEGLVLAAR